MLDGRCIRVAVTNTDLPVLEAMQRWFGGSIRRLSRSFISLSGRVRNAFQWNISGITAVRFLSRVRPHLIIKKEQARIVLDMHFHGNCHVEAKRQITELKRVEYSA